MVKRFKMVKTAVLCSVIFIGAVLLASILKNARPEEEADIVRIGVASYKEDDAFISAIIAELESVIKESGQLQGNQVRLDISDGKESQEIQNEQVERYINLDYDVICINLVDRTSAAHLIDQAGDAGIPLVFFNREPVEEDILRGEDVYYVGSDARESAILQGEIIIDAYGENPGLIDKNGNGIIEYAMLEGEAGHQDAVIRTEYSIKTLEDNGIKLNKVAGWSANFDRSQAAALVEQWVSEKKEAPELIISNNDDMALGAVDALERLGMKGIPIVGIDGTPQGMEAVKNKKMLGTAVSDLELYAKTLFELSYALGKSGGIPEDMAVENGHYLWIPWNIYVAQGKNR